jgi:hypothetical protein
LADGLEGYRNLLQEYWDGVYPTSPRARSSAVRMLSSRLGGDERTMGLVEARQELLFSIESKFQSDLDKGSSISEVLRREFENNGILLSKSATISVKDQIEKEGERKQKIKENIRWQITDNDNKQEFTIRKGEGRLDIYVPVRASDVNALQRIYETVKALNTEIQDKFPGGALSLKNIADTIEDKLKKIAPPPVAPAAVSQPATTKQPIAPVSTTSPVQEEKETSQSEVPAETTPVAVQQQVAESKPTVEETPPAGKTTREAKEIEEEAPTPTQPVIPPQWIVEQPQTTVEETTLTVSGWKTRSEAIDTITQAVAFLRSQNPRDVIPYRILRSVRWDNQQLPSSDPKDPNYNPDWRGNKAPFPLPQSDRRADLNKLVESKNWEALLKQSEELFAEGNCHFWLDLQRYIDTALRGLGADYDAVRKAILRETAMLVNRLPKITELSYRDGTRIDGTKCPISFADEETKAWIKKEVHPILSVGGTGVPKESEDASLAQAGDSEEQKKPPPPSEVTKSTSAGALASLDVQQIEVGSDGAKVEISIKIFTK